MNDAFCVRPGEEAPLCQPTRATVHAGGIETGYLRTGCGSPLVLLLAEEEREPTWHARLADLARTHRVIVPDTGLLAGPSGTGAPTTLRNAGDAAGLCAWFRLFLDGLGLNGVTLVAGGRFGSFAQDFAAGEPDRVLRVLRWMG